MRWACILVHVLYIFVCYEFIVSPGHGPMGLFSRYPPRKNPSVLPSEYADILPKHGPSLRGAQKHRSSVRSVDIYHNVVTLDYR